MHVALTIAFYVSAVGGLVIWVAAIRASGRAAQRLYVTAALSLAVAGVLGMFSIGGIFLVLSVLCLAAGTRGRRRAPAPDA
jgi:hypothetical protein